MTKNITWMPIIKQIVYISKKSISFKKQKKNEKKTDYRKKKQKRGEMKQNPEKGVKLYITLNQEQKHHSISCSASLSLPLQW